MTVETSTSIEPKDITAVEFECRNCGTKTIRKIDAKFKTPIICGNCSDVWSIDGNPDMRQLAEFLRMLEHYSKYDLRYILRFQVPHERNAKEAK
jgi:predicted RNA-binding Zn-ribbon protein involved in translation (DUF1610 family)